MLIISTSNQHQCFPFYLIWCIVQMFPPNLFLVIMFQFKFSARIFFSGCNCSALSSSMSSSSRFSIVHSFLSSSAASDARVSVKGNGHFDEIDLWQQNFFSSDQFKALFSPMLIPEVALCITCIKGPLPPATGPIIYPQTVTFDAEFWLSTTPPVELQELLTTFSKNYGDDGVAMVLRDETWALMTNGNDPDLEEGVPAKPLWHCHQIWDDKIRTASCTYIHVLSLCHLYPLLVTWRIQMKTFKRYFSHAIFLTTLHLREMN